jgi:flagellar biosynthesis chaperone FliJ
MLGAVLKVRKLREDMAKAEAAEAQAAMYRAASEHARREAELAGRPAPGSEEAAHWLATRAVVMSMAGDVATMRELRELRRVEAGAALERFATAKREHEGVEDLVARQMEAERREREAAEQREADDRAAARLFRSKSEEDQ